MDNALDLTIIVVSHVSSKTLEQCLRHIHSQKTTFRYRVMIVHSGSEPIDNAVLSEFNEMCFHIVEERWLPTQARNWGLFHCESEWVMYVDSDCLLDKGYIENMMTMVTQMGIDGLGGCVRNANPQHLPGFVMHQLEFSEWAESNTIVEAHNFPTCNSIYRRSALIEMGRFPDIYPCEDTIMNHRLHLGGYKLFFWGRYGIRHIHQKGWWNVAKYNYLHGVAYGYTTQRYHLEGYQLYDFPRVLTVGFIILGRYLRITKRVVRNRSNALLWFLCTPYTLICLLMWAVGYVNHHKYVYSDEKMNLAIVEKLKI